MQVEVTCRHGSIDTESNAYIVRKSEKLLTFFERVTAIGVTVDFEGGRVKVEMLVDAEHKHNFVASSTGENTIAEFDKTLSKMEQQIKKYKEKLQDHRRDPAMNEFVERPED